MKTTATHFGRLFLPAVLLGLLLTSDALHAQYADTFHIAVADKTPDHPYYNVGYEKGYLVNGEQSPTIVLVRNHTYLFDTKEVPSNLVFDLYTVPIGGSINKYRDHVDKEFAASGIITIKVTDATLDTFYYASSRQVWMGGTIVVVDSITTSVEEQGENRVLSSLAGATLYPNPFSQETELRFVLDSPSRVRVDVLNLLGQVVGTQDVGVMESGEGKVQLDASALPPGVYLYRVEAVSDRKRSVATGRMQVLR